MKKSNFIEVNTSVAFTVNIFFKIYFFHVQTNFPTPKKPLKLRFFKGNYFGFYDI